MDSQEEISRVAKQISFLAAKQRFEEFEPIVQDIFRREDRISFLAGLANELSGAFDKMCLVGLQYVIALDEADYTKLFELARGKDIAMYNLTGFLLTYGGATKSVLQNLCKDFSEILKIKQFQQRLDSDRPSPEEANERLYKYLNVPAAQIKTFRAKIAAMT